MRTELEELLRRAINFLHSRKDPPVLARYFYRNKPQQYYLNILRNYPAIMETYDKDENGDQASAINGAIKGLFFAAKVDKNTGLPPESSPFGDTRLNIPLYRLMHTESNIYFADFYCKEDGKEDRPHYVTLVVTDKGSAADQFCKTHNLPNIGLCEPSNQFLFYRRLEDSFYCCSRLLVEILYTENICLEEELKDENVFFSSCRTRGRGHSTEKGIPKNSRCTTCNVHQTTVTGEF